MGRASIIGGGGADVDIYVNGPTSSLAAPHKAEFLLHVAEGDAPASYQLVRLTQKKDRREYVRVALRRGSDGEIEAVKHPQDGAGILTSLTETDGLLEFPEDVTSIAPGDRVGFLSYAALVG